MLNLVSSSQSNMYVWSYVIMKQNKLSSVTCDVWCNVMKMNCTAMISANVDQGPEQASQI